MRQPNTNPSTCNRVFVSKSYEASIYKWSPPCNQIKKKIEQGPVAPTPYYCNATAGSQGQDWITGYVYSKAFVNNQHERLAYVECDYVE